MLILFFLILIQFINYLLDFRLFLTIILSFWLLYLLLENPEVFKNQIMEKNINWQEINYQADNIQLPCKRWGHKTVLIYDQIILFGGFSDVTYLNDLWAYNIHTNRWRQIETYGSKPQGKSNFTMHFDQITNQLIIFGGGGPNKKRFNKISLLNWQNMLWTQYSNDDQNSPWERTYHSSQFKYPYLITFGGEGAANLDFDDLWAFNIETKQWKQIKTVTKNQQNEVKLKIEGRRFHSTSMIGYQFYAISGCRINYSCIPSMLKIDLKPFFQRMSEQNKQQQNPLELIWIQIKLSEKDQQMIERWGHSSENYNGKIYIFGGRNKEDYNDLLEFNPQTKKIIKLNFSSEMESSKLPKSRRRHSSCMIGASMIIFGGFNVQYFNDMQYVSFFECRDSFNLEKSQLFLNQQIIQLQEPMFNHFIQEVNKDKTQYDLQILIESRNQKNNFIIKSNSKSLQIKSQFFKNLMKYNYSTNPQRKVVSLNLEEIYVSIPTFQIFNTFLLKDLLILPKNSKLKIFCQLLMCADYFQSQSMLLLIQKILSFKIINNSSNVDDILNISAKWKMKNLLKLCAQKKIIDRSYYRSYSKLVSLNVRAARLKEKFIEEMLVEIQFDEIQKGSKQRNKKKMENFGREIREINLVAQEKGLQYILGDKRRKRSFVEKLYDTFNKFCSSQNTPSLQHKYSKHPHSLQKIQNQFQTNQYQTQTTNNQIQFFFK